MTSADDPVQDVEDYVPDAPLLTRKMVQVILLGVLKATVPLLLMGLLYGACSWAFSAASRNGGLLTPDAILDPQVAILGLGSLALRLSLLFVAFPLAIWRLFRITPGD